MNADKLHAPGLLIFITLDVILIYYRLPRIAYLAVPRAHFYQIRTKASPHSARVADTQPISSCPRAASFA